eukprot:TRINITY_DN2231_c0_g2_i1.p1 TRINITY_DN2231_c0_g2~~TRINITY_DN2231_c0_g2_i1.p1  ORF type:complete len:322 (+),score=55.22 TRINITY_DN2231_c0_g2_i1:56-1021(+)
MPRDYTSKRKGMARIRAVDEYPKLSFAKGEVDFSLPKYVTEMRRHPILRKKRPQSSSDKLTCMVLSGKILPTSDPNNIRRYDKRHSLTDSLSKIAKRMQLSQAAVHSKHFKRCLVLQYLSSLRSSETTPTPPTVETQPVDNKPLPWVEFLEQKTNIKLTLPKTTEMGTLVSESDFNIEDVANPPAVAPVEGYPEMSRVNTCLRPGLQPYATITVHSDDGDKLVPLRVMLPQVYVGRFGGGGSPSEIDVSAYSKNPKLISRKHLQLVSEASGIRITPLGLNSIEVSVGDQEPRWISANTPPLLLTQRSVITIADVTMVVVPG